MSEIRSGELNQVVSPIQWREATGTVGEGLLLLAPDATKSLVKVHGGMVQISRAERARGPFKKKHEAGIRLDLVDLTPQGVKVIENTGVFLPLVEATSFALISGYFLKLHSKRKMSIQRRPFDFNYLLVPQNYFPDISKLVALLKIDTQTGAVHIHTSEPRAYQVATSWSTALDLDILKATMIEESESASSPPTVTLATIGDRPFEVSSKEEMPSLRVDAYGETNIGEREKNEDYFRIVDSSSVRAPMEMSTILIVADGLGGRKAGEIASMIVGLRVPKAYFKNRSVYKFSRQEAIISALEQANTEIIGRATVRPDAATMMSTAVAAVVEDDDLTIGYAGDSRAMIIRTKQKKLAWLTADDSPAFQRVMARRVRGDQAVDTVDVALEPDKNIINQALGDEQVEIHLVEERVQAGDRLLICSDGLWEQLQNVADKREVADIIINAASPQATVKNLMAWVLEKGKPKEVELDNITIIAAFIHEQSQKIDS